MADENFMTLALREAEKNLATGDGGPFGAVIVKDKKVIALAHNEVLKNKDATCHAEMQAIRLASQKLGTFDLSGCELYTSCYPCPMCLGAIIWANIRRVYYGNTAADAAAIGFRDDYIYEFIKQGGTDVDVLNLTQMDREQALTAFQQFAKTDKGVTY